MIVRELDGRDSGCRSKLLRARQEVANHGTLHLQSDLRDTVGSVHLLPLTLTPGLEPENQGATEGAKKALFSPCQSQSNVECSQMLKGI